MTTVALDAMGSDEAPRPEVEGALRAVRRGGCRVVLVGDEPRIQNELTRLGAQAGDRQKLAIQHASQVIAMGDHPAQAARGKRDASMRVAFQYVKDQRAHAVVSAGNSGAMLALGLFVLGRAPHVDRPAIASTLPAERGGTCALLDSGANVDCKPEALAQFAAMGAAYARVEHKKARPRVGLLANGTEPQKGTELTRQASAILGGYRSAYFDYVGYVEGRDLFGGQVDVAVTDGFTGNLLLKGIEGVAGLAGALLRDEVFASLPGKLAALLVKGPLRALRRKMDYGERGGAPLIGVDGVAVLCHGASNATAIANGLGVAAKLADQGALPAAVTLLLAELAPHLHSSAESSATATATAAAKETL